jgi:hypothetical protein
MIEEEQLREFKPYYERFKVSEQYFIIQTALLYELAELITKLEKPGRLAKLGVLLFSLNSNSVAINKLFGEALIGEGQIIGRAFLEKCANFCYLNVCDEKEYDNYLSWSSYKIVHSVEVKQRAYKNIEQDTPLPESFKEAKNSDVYKKFSGKKGGKKFSWTNVSLYHRIKYIKEKISSFEHRIYLATMNQFYDDASEEIHGTLYGITYHTGIMFGEKRRKDSYKFKFSLCSEVHLLLGLLINGILQVMSTITPADELLKKSKQNYDSTIGKLHAESKKHKETI